MTLLETGRTDDNNHIDDNASSSSSSSNSSHYEEEFDFIQSQWENGVETGLHISWPGSHRPLQLSTKLTEDRIAPLFDGTQWAGTRVWKAAIVALEYILSLTPDHPDLDSSRRYQSLLELGCGLGVPGMIWHLLQEPSIPNDDDDDDGEAVPPPRPPLPRVVLTDMPDLLPQLEANVQYNFPNSYGTTIQAKPLGWSKEGLQALWQQEEQERERNQVAVSSHSNTHFPKRPVFDICLNCDCIYEPLYGRQAWESLADVLAEVARLSPSTLIVTSVERRTADGVEHFCQRFQESGTIQSLQLVLRNDEDPHQIIEVYITKGIERKSEPSTLSPSR